MSVRPEPPPLGAEQIREILRRLGDVTADIVLVGGQALAFWVERYALRFELPGPVNSRDIDFGGPARAVSQAAERLDGTFQVPEPFEETPNSGLVEFRDGAGHTRRIDFLAIVFGLELSEIFEMAIGVEEAGPHGVTSFQVMHPVHCLEARVANVGGLPGYETPLGLAQARASVYCAKAYLEDRLDEGAIRTVLRLNERIYRFCYANRHARTVFVKHGIDAFDAVLDDARLPVLFRTERYPRMRAKLDRRRTRWRTG